MKVFLGKDNYYFFLNKSTRKSISNRSFFKKIIALVAAFLFVD